MIKYIKWTDEYREKMEQTYHDLARKTGLFMCGGHPISSTNMTNGVLKQHIDDMEAMK